MRIPYDDLFDGLLRVLLKLGFEQQRASLCARLFADANRDGFYSHGLNRFPQFVRMIQKGVIAVNAEPELVASFGSLEMGRKERSRQFERLPVHGKSDRTRS